MANGSNFNPPPTWTFPFMAEQGAGDSSGVYFGMQQMPSQSLGPPSSEFDGCYQLDTQFDPQDLLYVNGVSPADLMSGFTNSHSDSNSTARLVQYPDVPRPAPPLLQIDTVKSDVGGEYHSLRSSPPAYNNAHSPATYHPYYHSPQTASPSDFSMMSTPNTSRDIISPHVYSPSSFSPDGDHLHPAMPMTSMLSPDSLRQYTLSPFSKPSTSIGPTPSPPGEQPQDEFQDEEEPEGDEPRAHIEMWKRVLTNAITATGTKNFIPQTIYKPHTQADQDRYIKIAILQEPIIFCVGEPAEWGIPLDDALRQRLKRLQGKDDLMFQDCGPSVSIRLQWPGYQPWSRQIPTKDFKNPKGPITKAKLAKNIAKCVTRFIEENHNKRMEDGSDKKYRVGLRHITAEDLILVSLHHISQGSWQPQLRLKRLPWKY